MILRWGRFDTLNQTVRDQPILRERRFAPWLDEKPSIMIPASSTRQSQAALARKRSGLQGLAKMKALGW